MAGRLVYLLSFLMPSPRLELRALAGYIILMLFFDLLWQVATNIYHIRCRWQRFLHSPTQTTLSSVKLWFSSSQDDCYQELCNATPLQ